MVKPDSEPTGKTEEPSNEAADEVGRQLKEMADKEEAGQQPGTEQQPDDERLNEEEARVAAEAEKEFRDLREGVLSKEVIDQEAKWKGQKALNEYRAQKEKLKNLDSLPRAEQLEVLKNMTSDERRERDEKIGDSAFLEIEKTIHAGAIARERGKLSQAEIEKIAESVIGELHRTKTRMGDILEKEMVRDPGVAEKIIKKRDRKAVQVSEFEAGGILPPELDADVALALKNKRIEIYKEATRNMQKILGGPEAVEALLSTKEEVLGDIENI